MKELSNLDFDRIFGNNKHYGGTYAKDVIPKLLKKFYIINMCNENDDVGTHWTCFSNVRPNEVLYFDPFGTPSPEHALARMKATKKPVYYNDMRIQNINSTNCGYYCAYVLQQLEKGRKFADIILDFDLNTKGNEKLIEQYSKLRKIKAGAGIYDKLKSIYNTIAPNFLQPSNKHTKQFQKYLDTHGKDPIVSIKVGQKPVNSAITKALNYASLGKFDKTRKKLGIKDLTHSYLIITSRNPKGELITKKVERNHKIAAVDPSGDDYKTLYNIPLNNKKINFSQMFDKAKQNDDNFDIYDASIRNCQGLVNSVLNNNGLTPTDPDVQKQLEPQDGKQLIESLGPLEPLPKLLTGIANVGENIKEKIGLGVKRKRNKKGRFVKNNNRM